MCDRSLVRLFTLKSLKKLIEDPSVMCTRYECIKYRLFFSLWFLLPSSQQAIFNSGIFVFSMLLVALARVFLRSPEGIIRIKQKVLYFATLLF